MNEFAKLLSAFVKEKGVKIQPFARYCGYDRANMYKILKGQRNLPGREIVEKAAKYMHLLPSEEEKLWEAYEYLHRDPIIITDARKSRNFLLSQFSVVMLI